MPSVAERLGLCSWSLEPLTPQDLIEKMRQIGLNQVQLGMDPLWEDPRWARGPEELAKAGIQVVGGMMRSVGEDYSSLEAIRRTGGVVPDETWPKTWANFQKIAPIAKDMGLRYVMFHAGFLPHDPKDPSMPKLMDRLRRVADLFGKSGIRVGFETGQEDGPTLLAFLNHLKHPNVGVNFDPANMILYDKGDPIEALKLLAPHVLQCHIKDARKTKVTGTWGEEVVVGTGEVDWKSFFAVLAKSGFNGPMALEREAGTDRVGDIRAGKEYVLRMAKS